MSGKRWRALTAIGTVLVLSSVPSTVSEAAPSAELVGYQAVASGKAFTAVPSVPALLPVDAPAEGTLSLATATLSSGGLGFGRASTFFPGTPIAGIRPLIEVASGQRLPIPDYPVVVESREFEDEKVNDQPGITMSSDVDPDRAVVVADAGAAEIPGAFAFGSSRTVSTSLLEGSSSLSATSSSTVKGLELGGVVAIDVVTSTATVTSDAAKAECSGSVVLSGVTVAGQPATIDTKGIHVEDEPVVPGLAAPDVEAALKASGVTVRVLGGSDACEGAGGTRTTSGLLISVPLPAAGSIPEGGHFDVILASTSATVGASTLPPFVEPAFEPPPSIGDVLPAPVAAASPVPAAPPAASAPTITFGPTTTTQTEEVARYAFAGVPAPLVAGLVLLAIPVARRLRLFMARTLVLAAGA